MTEIERLLAHNDLQYATRQFNEACAKLDGIWGNDYTYNAPAGFEEWFIDKRRNLVSHDFYVDVDCGLFAYIVLPIYLHKISPSSTRKIVIPVVDIKLRSRIESLFMGRLSFPDNQFIQNYSVVSYDQIHVDNAHYVIISQTYHRDNPAESDRIAKLDKTVFRFIGKEANEC